MNAREEILARVRKALEGADKTTVIEQRNPAVVEQRPSRLGPGPRTSGTAKRVISRDHLVNLFAERIADYQADVHRCSEGEVPGLLAQLLGERTTVVPAGFDWTVPNPVEDGDLTAAQLDGIDAVVTTAALGIAITGTIVLTHGPGQGRRALSLVPDLHVCVVREDQVVENVPEAVAALDPAGPQTWISGPSATSDIELNRVEGVHGPRTLQVVLVS